MPNWQQAIDRQDYLVRLELAREQPEAAAGLWRASLEGAPVIFEMRERSAPNLLNDSSRRWRFAFSVAEELDTRARIAGALAAVAYAAATGGRYFDEVEKSARLLGDLRDYADIYSALAVGRREECAARYPGTVRLTASGGAIVTRVLSYGNLKPPPERAEEDQR